MNAELITMHLNSLVSAEQCSLTHDKKDMQPSLDRERINSQSLTTQAGSTLDCCSITQLEVWGQSRVTSSEGFLITHSRINRFPFCASEMCRLGGGGVGCDTHNVYETSREFFMQQGLNSSLGSLIKFQNAIYSFIYNNIFHCKLILEHYPCIKYNWINLLWKYSWSKI